ncbi:MAG: transcriptional repressor [Acidobacteria bacterium]|nr:transcriptional repressor [Acidobacteriota bacterium]
MKAERKVLDRYLQDSRRKRSRKRDVVLEYFLRSSSHISAEDLYDLVHREHPEIGRSTVYRALKLFCDSGVARQVDLKDGRMRYEHHLRRPHHDHMVCTRCGQTFEFICQEIESLQERAAASIAFAPESHSLQIYGVCKDCRRGEARPHVEAPRTSRRPIEVK